MRQKFYLLNWNTIRVPKLHGGSGIRDPSLMNVTFGAKLDWKMRTHPNWWWAQILKEKYQQRPEVDHHPKHWSPIWKLILSASFLISYHLSWIPGIGKSIKLWEDSILHHSPQEQGGDLRPLKNILKQRGMTTLAHISDWNNDDLGKDWNLGKLSQTTSMLLVICL